MRPEDLPRHGHVVTNARSGAEAALSPTGIVHRRLIRFDQEVQVEMNHIDWDWGRTIPLQFDDTKRPNPRRPLTPEERERARAKGRASRRSRKKNR